MLKIRGVRVPLLRRRRCMECGKRSKELYCDVCGHELAERTRDEVLKYHRYVW